jgi:DNA-binding MarR family transcriptional regulator
MKSSHICGFTPPQLLVLKYVKERHSVTMSDISNEMGLGSSTTSGIIDRLVKQGILTRSRRELDRRVIYIELTEKAKEMISKIDLNHEVFYQSLFSKLSNEDKEQMTIFLEKLYSVLTETLPDFPKDK